MAQSPFGSSLETSSGRHCKSPETLCVGFMSCVLLLFRLGSGSGDALGSVV